jgi:cyclophilin family peptidyl-prolyl cis-trans isomerase
MRKSRFIILGAIIAAIITVSFKPTQTPVKPEQLVEIRTTYGTIIIKLYNETPLHRDNFIKNVREGFYDSLLFHLAVPELIIQGGDPRSKYANPGDRFGNLGTAEGVPMEIKKELYHKRGALAAPKNLANQYESDAYQFYIVQGKTFSADDLLTIQTENNVQGKQAVLNSLMQSDSVKAKVDDFKLRGDKDGLHTYLVSLETVLNEIFLPLEFTFPSYQVREYLKVGGAPHLDGRFTVFGEVVQGIDVVDRIAALPRDENNRPLKDVRMRVRLLNQPKAIPKPAVKPKTTTTKKH